MLPRFALREPGLLHHALARLSALLCALLVSASALAANDVRISQVYGGGGNSGAPYNADFVELYNAGATSAAIGGWTITYASATGTWGGAQFTFPPNTVLPAGGYLLVQMSTAGATGAALTPDFTSATSIAMSTTDGNVALLSAAQSGTSNNCASLTATLVDKVAYGNGNCPEGTAAGAPANATAVIRRGNGTVDTDSNSADFFVGTPMARNLAHIVGRVANSSSTPAADGWTVETTGTTSTGVVTADLATPAWSLGAATGGTASATRSIPVSQGRTFSMVFENGTVPSGAPL